MNLLTLIAEAVWDSFDDSRRMGAVLSGGVDSSTVVALARTIDSDLPTFTGYYEEAGFSELKYARLVAGPNHHEILITPDDFVENFDAMLEHTPRPVQGMGTFGQYMVAKYASQHIDVALSGEGSRAPRPVGARTAPRLHRRPDRLRPRPRPALGPRVLVRPVRLRL
jgi:asparagine synthetase B (glutamine-hydrolysing)